MAPPQEKPVLKGKYHIEHLREGSKQKLFSFRWLLRKSKSSRSAKEMSQCTPATAVPTSKSCDTGLTALDTVDRCPTFLLWKLLPPPAIARKPNRHRGHQLPFRASFSCSDVHVLESPENSCKLATSLIKQHPSQSCYKLCRSTASRLDTSCSQESLSPSSSAGLLCKLCLIMMPSSSMYYLQDCGCAFCITCLSQYLWISIREGHIPVTCPDADCPTSGSILISEIKEIAGDDALFMFERYKLNLDVDLDPGRVWCPSPGCETICPLQPSSRPTLVHCHSCRLKFCSLCKLRWHGKATCEDARKALSDEIELSLSEEECCIKRCPNCRIPIEKEDGCAQMMCYRCKHVFCWHCLASLDEDFLLRHYDKGPCRNKLGHSRASMIWHRTQVVGIFAGFSLLLLLASPFLLLATPCLLCCRCKNKDEGATPL